MAQTRLGTYSHRKIEQRMCEAVHAIRNWREGNTEVKAATNEATGLPVARVYLHGHHIANLNQVRHDALELQVIELTLGKWPTNTTISRLRALGADITVKRREVSLNGRYIASR